MSVAIAIYFTTQELDTMLAALRWWQRTGNVPGSEERDMATEHGAELDQQAIDCLCERINL